MYTNMFVLISILNLSFQEISKKLGEDINNDYQIGKTIIVVNLLYISIIKA